MAQDAHSQRRRGRKPVFSETELQHAAQFAYARRVHTRRGAQDLVYRKFAVAALELYREAHPDRGAALDWLLAPMPRYSLLSELGRVAEPRSSDSGSLEWSAQDVNRLIEVAFEIAETKPSTKTGIAIVRDRRRRYRSAA